MRIRKESITSNSINQQVPKMAESKGNEQIIIELAKKKNTNKIIGIKTSRDSNLTLINR
jgi:hypothetical protein